MEWMILPLKRYAQFSGRSRRKEFWRWTLFLILASLALSIVDQALHLGGAVTPTTTAFGQPGRTSGGGVLTSLFSIATLLPNLAVQVRRLHETDRSGWWLLLPLVPIVIGVALVFARVGSGSGTGQPFGAGTQGMVTIVIFFIAAAVCAVLLFVWFCMDGTRGANRFGEDPKAPQDLGEVFR